MKFKIRGELDHVVKTIEFDRADFATLQLNDVKQQLERKFKLSNAGLRYSFSDGRQQPLYQDHHLVEVLKDVQRSGAKHLNILLTNAGGSAPSTASYSSAPSSYNSAPASYNSAPPTSSSSNSSRTRATSNTATGPSTKACPTCGTQLAIVAKFCSGCGTKC